MFDKAIRPVESYFLACYSTKKDFDAAYGASLVLFYLKNQGLLSISKNEGGLIVSSSCDYLLPVLRNYEFLAMKAIAGCCSEKLIAAIEEHNFLESLTAMGYLTRSRIPIFSSSLQPNFSLTKLGEEIAKNYRVSDYRVPTAIRSYVEIAAKTQAFRALSYAPISRTIVRSLP